MINPTQRIEMTAMEYASQFNHNTYKYYNYDIYLNRASVEKMYKNKYARQDYSSALHPFKVDVI